jgi:hypothetical protein
VTETARASGFSRQAVYRAIGRGDLRASVVCSRMRIHPDDFLAKHILPRVGGLPLREVTSAVVADLSADLQRAGVGPAAIRKALTVL